MTTLVADTSANGTYKYKAPGGPITLHGYGTWNGATVAFSVALDDGTDEDYIVASAVADSDLSFTENFVRQVTIQKGYWLIMTVSGVGGSTSLTLSV